MENQPLEEDAKKAVEQLGLSESNYTVIEGVGQGCPAGPIYRPQADISNLFLPVVEATLNHLEQRSGKEQAFAYFRTRLSDFFHSEALKLDGFEYAKEVGDLVKSIGDNTDNKEDYDQFFRSFFRSCLVAYTFAARAKMHDDAKNLVSKNPIKFFALLDIFDDLSEETKMGLIRDFSRLHIWDVE